MDARSVESNQLSDLEASLLTPKTPDLSLKRLERVVSFRLPKSHRKDPEADDLPDITPQLTTKLKALWNLEDVVEEQPVRVVVQAVRDHLDAINPYLEALKATQRSWFECWQFLYKISHELDHVSESNKRFYSVPESLRLLELQAHMNLGKADSDLLVAQDEYITEVDKRRQELITINAKIKGVTDAQDMVALAKYAKPIVPQKSSAKPGCLALVYSLFACKPGQKQAVPVPAEDAKRFSGLREKLLKDLNDELRFKTTNLNEFADAGAPTKSTNYRTQLNEIRAQILHNQIDFYRAQSKESMLHAVRLYVLAFRTFYLIYGENPLATEKEIATANQANIKKITSAEDKLVWKARDLFRQMIKGMKSHLSLFYCEQPDRCDFSKYLDNYNNIKQTEERDAILAGKATVEMIDRVFPEFESPEEAFQLPVPGK